MRLKSLLTTKNDAERELQVLHDLVNKFSSKLNEISTSLGNDGFEQFIKGLTPEILTNPKFLPDLYTKCLAAGENDDN